VHSRSTSVTAITKIFSGMMAGCKKWRLAHLKFLPVGKLSENLLLVGKYRPEMQNLGLKSHFEEM